MRKHSSPFVCLMLLVLCLPFKAAGVSDLQGKVVEVIDGETVVITYGSNLVKVRLYTICAPKKGHPLAEVARQHLADFLSGKVVSVQYSQRQPSVIIGLVFVNGNDIGIQMVRDGAASFNSNYETELSSLTRQLYFESEQAARREKRGIWAADLPSWPPSIQAEVANSANTRSSGQRPSDVEESKQPDKNISSAQRPESVGSSVAAQSIMSSSLQQARSIVWSRGAAGCDDYFHEGQNFRIINGAGIQVVVTMYESKDYRVAEVLVVNKSDTRRLVDPSMSRFAILDQDGRIASLTPIPAEKIANKITKRAMWANIFSGIAASVPQTSTAQSTTSGNVNVRGSDGSWGNGTYSGTTTTTLITPNSEAQRGAAEGNRHRSATAAGRAEQIQNAALKMNTLFPGEHAAGIIYFEKKKFQKGVFQILIDGTIYQFLYAP